jgi:hypothetical protein
MTPFGIIYKLIFKRRERKWFISNLSLNF